MPGSGHMSEVDSDLLILNERLAGYINVGMDNTVDVAENVAEYCNEDESLKLTVKDIMRDFTAMETDIQQHVAALTHVKNTLKDKSSQEKLALSTMFNEKLKQTQAMERKNFEDHPKYIELEEKLTYGGNIEEQLDSLRVILGGAVDDEDVAMTSVEINTKCPFTGQTMITPVRNKICNHVYDRDGILSYINSRKAKAKCPVAGCDNVNPIRVENLDDHKDMKKYITLLCKHNHIEAPQ